MKVATIIKAKREPELVIEWNACEVVSFHVTERRSMTLTPRHARRAVPSVSLGWRISFPLYEPHGFRIAL